MKPTQPAYDTVSRSGSLECAGFSSKQHSNGVADGPALTHPRITIRYNDPGSLESVSLPFRFSLTFSLALSHVEMKSVASHLSFLLG